MAGFRATPSRRNPVLYGMVVYAIRFKNPLLHRQSTLRKRRLGENRVSGQTSSGPQSPANAGRFPLGGRGLCPKSTSPRAPRSEEGGNRSGQRSDCPGPSSSAGTSSGGTSSSSRCASCASGGCAGTWPGCSPRSAAGSAGTWARRSPRGSACSTRISPRPRAGSHSRCLPGSGGCSGCRYAAPGLPGSRSRTGAGARRFSRQPSNPSPSGPRTRPGRAGRARAEDGGSGTAYSGARASHGPAGTGHGGIKP